ncbi:SMP-30/gluconolactonase/LRE family protein [Aquibium sp. A9E412]|uniref:SMP-30/gluconolactonase/LRE family protein n=1 Tax=Aquibium sp. A9E412 TaxID=2976767 RepID=UPI0025AEEB97|nr:SMP-30/gluconolactonase/LRE family protein [Aquibium sp. A9E412]MDN2565517.1 SMP-30/gluconolactonase/LRE family protein [Aquibium sp. A9E412]
MTIADLALDCRNAHGEGILWNPADGRVWWTDIDGRRLWWLDPEAGRSDSIAMPDRVCCFAPRATGGFVLALADRFALFDPATEALETVAPFEPENPDTRLNDGRTDRQGRFVAGGMNEVTGAASSSVVRLDPDGTVTTLIAGVACANSTCFSADGRTMFFADSPQRTIRAYHYDPATGALGGARLFADLRSEAGVPDGACVDAEGGVWSAAWQGRRVVRIAPDGRIDAEIAVPVERPTCCAFGGAGLDTLFITTSRQGASAAQIAAEPLSGSLFACRPGVRGLADAPFAG